MDLQGTILYQILNIYAVVIAWILLLLSFGSAIVGSYKVLAARYSNDYTRDVKLCYKLMIRLSLVFVAILFLSPNVHFLIHHMGSLDQIYYLLVFMAFLLLFKCAKDGLGFFSGRHGAIAKWWIFSLSIFVAISIHESAVLTIFPSALWIFCLSGLSGRERSCLVIYKMSAKKIIQISIRVWIVVLLSFIIVAAATALLMNGIGPPVQLNLEERLNEISFPMVLRSDYFRYSFSSSVLLSLRLLLFSGQHKLLISGSFSVLVAMLTVAAGALFALGKVKRVTISTDFSARNSCIFIACIASFVFSPLLMSFLGWDFYRWTSLCLLNFLLLLSCDQISLKFYKSFAVALDGASRATRVLWLSSPRFILIFAFSILLFMGPGLFHGQLSYSMFDLTNSGFRDIRDALEGSYRLCLIDPNKQCIADLSEHDRLRMDPWSCEDCYPGNQLRKPWF
jgi:hypothetical protein